MAISDDELFSGLPALTLDVAMAWRSGQTIPLLLLQRTSSGTGVVFPVSYIHKTLTPATTSNQYPEAIGIAELLGAGKPRSGRITFSSGGTACLHARSLTGPVKIGQPFHQSLSEFLSDRD